MKRGSEILILSIILAILFVNLVSATWWNPSWDYKKQINFTGNYESDNSSVRLLVPITGNEQADGDDLRFLDSSETAELSYWIRSYNATTIEAFVRIGLDTTIYMYYGNAGASTTGAESGVAITDNHGQSFTGDSSVTGTYGVNISTNHMLFIVEVEREASATPTRFKIYDLDNNLLSNDSFNGAYVNVSTILSNNTQYKLIGDSNGASYTRRYVGNGAFYPLIRNNINYDSGVRPVLSSDIGDLYNFVDITTIRFSNLTASFLQEQSKDTSYPTFSSLQPSPPNNSIYSPSQTYQFNSTILLTNGTAGLEFNRINHTATNLSSVFSSTISSLGAGTYSYYWWAYGNGSSNLYNTSELNYYIVSPEEGNINLFINGNSSNKTIDNQTQVNLTAVLDSGVGDIFLYVNGELYNSGINTLENLTIFKTPGMYNVSTYYFGNQNYTSDSKTLWLNVIEYIPSPQSSYHSSSSGGSGGGSSNSIKEISLFSEESFSNTKSSNAITGNSISQEPREENISPSLYETFIQLLQEIKNFIQRIMAMFK